ncbi:MAG: deoxyribonuclease IV [Thermodesulfobacteriota bacterium]
MRLGFHLSIGGGFPGAVRQGLRTGCECGQIFSRNPRGWVAKPIGAGEAEDFRRQWRAAGFGDLAVHLPYLPNLAAEEDSLRRKSIQALTDELDRARLLGADYVVVHPGHARKDQARDKALNLVTAGLIQALSGLRADGGPRLLLETTSGQRGELGSLLSELAVLIRATESETKSRLGVCLDTAHVFAAGYDLSRPKGQEDTLRELDRRLGLDRLNLIHLNDSLTGLGSHRDRHAPVGRGCLGARALARWIRHPLLHHLSAIMETPRQTEADDAANMARAKRWRDSRH